MGGRVVADREEHPRIALPERVPTPHGRRLGMEEDRRVPLGPRIGDLAGGADGGPHRFRRLHPPGVVEPCGAERRVPVGGTPATGDPLRGPYHILHVPAPLRRKPRHDPRAHEFRGQSAPCRTKGGTIDPFGTVVWAIRFHPLSSTPRPRWASATRLKGPITDSRPTLDTPSMITLG